MTRFVWLAVAVVFLVPCRVQADAQPTPNELRATRDDLKNRGLWREVVDLYQAELRQISDAESGKDLESAVQALGQLGAWQEWDDLVEHSVKLHPRNAVLLQRAGMLYATTQHRGQLIAGEFRRGGRGFFAHRPSLDMPEPPKSAVGNPVNTQHRDRVRSLQLLRQSLECADTPSLQAEIWGNIASNLKPRDSWKLQVLTPLEKLPAWDDPGPQGGTEGAPWSGNAPLLYQVPSSWDAATSDGARWRFALAEQSRLAPSDATRATLALAEFSEQEFGTETLNAFGWWQEMDPSQATSLLEIDSLAEDECLAQTSAGVRRFRLPPDQHFIALYRSIQSQSDTAADALVSAFLNRRQYHLARQALEQAISHHGPGPEARRNELLKQITGNWGRFEHANSPPAGTRPSIPLVFRNAKSVELTAAPVDMEAVLRETMDYIRSNPKEIDWDRRSPASIAQRLIQGKSTKFIGKTAAQWGETLSPRELHRETRTHITMPIDRAGAWWVTAKVDGGNSFHTLIWIVDSVLVRRQVGDQIRWWLADAKDGSPVSAAPVEFFGFRLVETNRVMPFGRRFEVKSKGFSRTTDGDGAVWISAGDWDAQCDWLAIARPPGRPPTFIGFESMSWTSPNEGLDARDLGYAISDRPLYRPGDSVHLKFFLRQVSYNSPNDDRWANQPAKVVLTNGRGEEVVQLEQLHSDAEGSLEATVTLPNDAVLGQWNARAMVGTSPQVNHAGVSFRVEEFRKPEFEVLVEAPKTPVKLGDSFLASVSARYFHGTSVRQGSVEITVHRSSPKHPWFPGWRWDWLYGAGAWWNAPAADWHPRWNEWGCIPPPPPWHRNSRWTPDELVLKQTVPIGPDGKVTVTVDTATAKAVHGDLDATYSITARVTDASRREEQGNTQVAATRKPFSAVIWTDSGYSAPGAEVSAQLSAATLTGTPVPNATGTVTLLRLAQRDGAVTESEVRVFPVTTDPTGKASLRFPAPDSGQYRLALSLSVNPAEPVTAGCLLNVHGPGISDPSAWKFGPIELVADQSSYLPGNTAKLRVNSDQSGATVHLLLHLRDGAAREVRQFRLDGKSSEIQIPLSEREMPNTFVEAITVHGATVHSTLHQLLIPPTSHMLEVSLEPEQARVNPGQQSSLKVTVRDADGKPFEGHAVLAIYDKALEAVTGGSNITPIHEAFWNWKHEPGYTSGNDSLPSSCGNLVKPKQPEMESLDGFSDHAEDPFGSGFGSGSPRIMRKSVDRLDSMMPMVMAAPSSAMVADDAFAAEGAGNPPAPAQITLRKDFADLLKWSGSIRTDASGQATIPLSFPDNLTTWKARLWTLGSSTRVGEGSTEIIASKELLVRLQTPRFLVQGDEAKFGVIVQNDHPTAKSVDLSLDCPQDLLTSTSPQSLHIEVKPNSETLVEWAVTAKSTGDAVIRVKADAGDDGDALERSLPIRVRGMLRQEAWSRQLSPEQSLATIDFEVPEARRVDQTLLTVRYSHSVAGAVVDAIPYLASYPHGCTEQTLNRFVPAVVAQEMLKRMGVNLAEIQAKRTNLNPQELGDPTTRAAQWKSGESNPVFDEETLAQMVRSGVKQLSSMQNSDGGWGWFSGFGESSYPHTTAVVVHGLLTAKAHGAAVPQPMLDRGIHWLAAYELRQLKALVLFQERSALRKAGKPVPDDSQFEKSRCDAEDALLRLVLGNASRPAPEMLALLHRDRLDLPPYAQALVGLEHHRVGDTPSRDEILRVMSQFLRRDAENQTCYLDLPNASYWWSWFGSGNETHAWFLKLLTQAKPHDPDTRGLVKFLVNQRKHAASWDSTRDTAFAVEALAEWFAASGEDQPDLQVEVILDGKSLRSEHITRNNAFSFNGTVTVPAASLTTGKHQLEFRKSGKGSLYANAYLEVFSLEDQLRPAGLEVKTRRVFHRLVPLTTHTSVPDAAGLLVAQTSELNRREPLTTPATLKSGDLVEVELIIDSKNDYEYLLLTDPKPAGAEAIEGLSGYVRGSGISAYMEPRDASVNFFLRQLPRGTHTLRYTLRAESLGLFTALPTIIQGMYAPELRGNSDSFQLQIQTAPPSPTRQ